MAERRGTVFLLLGMLAWVVAGFAGAMSRLAFGPAGAVLLRQVFGFALSPNPASLFYCCSGRPAGFRERCCWARCGKDGGPWRVIGARGSGSDRSGNRPRSRCCAL